MGEKSELDLFGISNSSAEALSTETMMDQFNALLDKINWKACSY